MVLIIGVYEHQMPIIYSNIMSFFLAAYYEWPLIYQQIFGTHMTYDDMCLFTLSHSLSMSFCTFFSFCLDRIRGEPFALYISAVLILISGFCCCCCCWILCVWIRFPIVFHFEKEKKTGRVST